MNGFISWLTGLGPGIGILLHRYQMWSVYMLHPAWLTVEISVLGMVGAMLLGVVGVLGRLSPWKPLRIVSSVYVEAMRGAPLLVYLFIICLGLPQILVKHGIQMPVFQAAILTLAVYYAAYVTEVYRAGIESVDKGQREGALALGISPLQAFLRIIFPQAIRVCLPALTNTFVTLVQDSALLSAISVVELGSAIDQLRTDTFFFGAQAMTVKWQIYALGAAFYLAICLPLSILARYLERRLGKDSPASLKPRRTSLFHRAFTAVRPG